MFEIFHSEAADDAGFSKSLHHLPATAVDLVIQQLFGGEVAIAFAAEQDGGEDYGDSGLNGHLAGHDDCCCGGQQQQRCSGAEACEPCGDVSFETFGGGMENAGCVVGVCAGQISRFEPQGFAMDMLPDSGDDIGGDGFTNAFCKACQEAVQQPACGGSGSGGERDAAGRLKSRDEAADFECCRGLGRQQYHGGCGAGDDSGREQYGCQQGQQHGGGDTNQRQGAERHQSLKIG
ncbi:hypothetical protein LBMAG46_01630 [Planctomycetia bacterium]|nr:hypothetical protein LBMAG46_01630 [Planctomycetia bacterium]